MASLTVPASAVAATRRRRGSQAQKERAAPQPQALGYEGVEANGRLKNTDEAPRSGAVPVRCGRRRTVVRWLRVWSPVFVYVLVLLAASYGNDLSTAVGRAELHARHGGMDKAEELLAQTMLSEGAEEIREVLKGGAKHGSILYDAGAAWLVKLHDWSWLPDVGVAVMLVIVAVLLLAPVPSSAKHARWTRFTTMLWAHSGVLALRCLTSCATVYDASPRCRQQRLLQASNAGFLLNTGCFDLMFSGHASFSYLVGMFACLCPLGSLGSKAFAMVLASLSAAVNISVGDHHTADVLVGAYIGASMALLVRGNWADTFQHRHECKPAPVSPDDAHQPAVS